MPILWHIMMSYKSFGFNDFILALGYLGEKIINYFEKNPHGFKITFIDTGESTNTGGRIFHCRKKLGIRDFMVTYGDGVADINLQKLVQFHKDVETIGTITGVRPHSQFGIMVINKENKVQKFEEKPLLEHWINGGFFVFKHDFINYLSENFILEKEPLENLSNDRELSVYKHYGFWACMDTYKDNRMLDSLIKANKAPWITWEKKGDKHGI
ncbi:MAG TPA: glucose-1-phosphate cytidylyltransferase [Firmicutes bacterium]|nr:glucose-1-phosphate cytidylyltransferase [Bacillota bacterium]